MSPYTEMGQVLELRNGRILIHNRNNSLLVSVALRTVHTHISECAFKAQSVICERRKREKPLHRGRSYIGTAAGIKAVCPKRGIGFNLCIP